jgi:hypothetical protein
LERIMSNDPVAIAGSRTLLWSGRSLSLLAAALLLLDGVMKLFKPDFVIKATTDLGYPEYVIVPLGAVLIVCTLLYLIPRTAVLGAMLLNGYLGGAVASHVRHEDGAFGIVAPIIFAALVWGALCLRDSRLRALVFQRT